MDLRKKLGGALRSGPYALVVALVGACYSPHLDSSAGGPGGSAATPTRGCEGCTAASPPPGNGPAPDVGATRSAMDGAPEAAGNADPLSPSMPDSCESVNDFQIAPCPLPNPCEGSPFEVRLTAAGGADRYVWDVVRAPLDLSFSTQTLTLSGRSIAPGYLALRLTDKTTKETHETRLDWTPRRACSLATLSSETGPSRLQLIDPTLEGALGVTRSTRVTVPDGLPESESVAAFDFSPDGRFLTASVTAADGSQRLELFVAPEWRRLTLDVAGSVKYHAWSPDGRVLAVAYDDQGTTLLGGFVVSTAAPSAPGELPDVNVAALPGRPATVDSQLTWVGLSHIVYHTQAIELPPGERRLHHATLVGDRTTAGFGDDITDPGVTYTLSADGAFRLEPATNGFFTISKADGFSPLVDFHAFGDVGEPPRLVSHRSEAIASPTRRHTALSQSPADLVVYRSDETAVDPDGFPVPLISALAGCGRLLAWSSTGERIACVSDEEGRGVVQMFALDEATPTLLRRSIEGQYDYDANAAFERRRAFSPGGNWFAFATNERVFIANLAGDRAIVERAGQYLDPEEPARTAELLFSPDDGQLLLHDDTRLLRLGLTPPGPPVALNTEPLPPPEPCLEAEGSTTLGWCGSPGTHSADVHWSPDSRVVAYRLATGELRAVRVATGDELPVAPACGAGCSSTFAFQP